MNRYDIINTLITKYKYKTYLEIGTFRGETFSKIKCENKICVDPVKKYDGLTYEVTSDEFFESIAPTLNMKFDIIFIDGLHICEQVIKDVDNALKYLNENGTIVMHDCNPTMYEHQTVPPSIPQWTGTTWRAFLHYRITRDDLEMYTVNTDWGCGVIRRGNGGRLAKFETNDIPYDVFDQNRTEILNLISINQFIQK